MRDLRIEQGSVMEECVLNGLLPTYLELDALNMSVREDASIVIRYERLKADIARKRESREADRREYEMNRRRRMTE